MTRSPGRAGLDGRPAPVASSRPTDTAAASLATGALWLSLTGALTDVSITVTMAGQASPALNGVPEVWASGQGGLLDVVTDGSYAQNKTIYFCFAERTGGGGRTAVARAKLNDVDGRLDDVKIIFRQEGPLSSGNHYGCRIPQGNDGNLFFTLGEHFIYRDEAQNLANHLGYR